MLRNLILCLNKLTIRVSDPHHREAPINTEIKKTKICQISSEAESIKNAPKNPAYNINNMGFDSVSPNVLKKSPM